MPGKTEQHPIDERDLLRRAQKLDEQALGIIFDEFYDSVYQYIYRFLRHPQAAEDLTADVFRLFLERLNTRRGPGLHLKAWLYKTAHELILADSKRSRRRAADELPEELADELQGMRQAEKSILDQELLEAMGQLTDKQQEVLYLRFFQNLALEEVAYVLNMTLGTVKSLQHRGLQSMRRFLNFSDEVDGYNL
jgi:RNA polymerase sigma-70 factor, ECF subfamily